MNSLFAQSSISLDQGIVQLASELEKMVSEKIKDGVIQSETRTAVMDILEANTHRRLELSDYIESGLTTELVKTSQLSMLDREKTLKARDVLEKPIREIAGTPLIPKGVDFSHVVTGRYSVVGDESVIVIQLLALKNAQIIAGTQVKVTTSSIPTKLLGVAGLSVAERELSHLNRVDAAEGRGDHQGAVILLEEFLLKFPNSTRTTEVQTRLDSLKSANTKADQQVRAAELLMTQEGMDSQAKSYLQGIVKQYPKAPAAIKAAGLLIVLDLRADQPEALKHSFDFEAQYSQHPVLVKIQDARNAHQERKAKKSQSGDVGRLLAEGMSFYENNQIAKSRERLQTVVFDFPDSEEAVKAKQQLGIMDQDESKAKEILAVAKILYNNQQTHQLARNELLKIKNQFPKTISNVGATGYLIILDFKEQKDASREAAYFLVNFPSHHLAPEVKNHQEAFLKTAVPTEPGAEQLEIARKMLTNELRDQGVTILKELKADYPQSRVGVEATGLLLLDDLKRCRYQESEVVRYVTINRDSKLSISILEAQNSALKTCRPEDLAPKIEGMVFITGGEVMVGVPRQKIHLDPYYMDIYEVTNTDYQTCVDTGRCKRSLYIRNKKFNPPDHPVVGVSWKSANNYCLSIDKRLPTEYEWEWAALGAEDRPNYPEKGLLPTIAHYKENTSYRNPTQKVGIKQPNAAGIYDMVGNASEWVSDWHDVSYYANIPYQNPNGPPSGSKKVHRGGNWSSNAGLLIPLNRAYDYDSKKRNTLGFRCAKSYPTGK